MDFERKRILKKNGFCCGVGALDLEGLCDGLFVRKPGTQSAEKCPLFFPISHSGFYEWPGLSINAIWGDLFFTNAITYFDNSTLLAGIVGLNLTLINDPNTRESCAASHDDSASL